MPGRDLLVWLSRRRARFGCISLARASARGACFSLARACARFGCISLARASARGTCFSLARASTRGAGTALLALVLSAFAGVARAQLLHAPIGGRSIPLGEGKIACEANPERWGVELHGRSARPPNDEAAIGQTVALKVASSPAECDQSEEHVTLIAVDRYPVIDLATVVFSPDEGRLEAEGARLLGVAVVWESSAKTDGADRESTGESGRESGHDICRDVYTERGVEHCTWGVGRNAPADPAITKFTWLPRGARGEPDAVFYDAAGRQLPPESFNLVPARITLTRLVPADAAVDLATGQGEVPLVHPEAVGSAECGPLQCEMSQGKLIVRGAASLVGTVDVRLRLVAHVFLLRKDQLDAQVTVRLPVLHCPMAIASGPPIRNNDEAKVIVKVEGRCARDLTGVRFVLRDTPLKVLQTLNDRDATYVALQLGRIGADTLTITAIRGEGDGIALAVAYTPTRSAPQVRAALELPGYPNLSFIPNNRWATVHVSPAGEHQRFALLPIEGIYMVQERPGAPALIRAEPHAAGLTVLRFGLRAASLPAGLDQIDLAVAEDPLQRGTGEANIPASIEGGDGKLPLVEFLCGGGSLELKRIEIGETAYVSYDLRDTCRVVFHRERLDPEWGTQKLNFEVDVLRPDGSPRGDAHVAQVVTLRAGKEPRYAWIKGITDPFDRVSVRVSHVPDEDHYIGGAELSTGAPAAQWSAVLGAGHFRLYGTSTIPTGLYRFGGNDKASGVLALNFGVISRLAWLDKDGREFPLALETGVLVFGISNTTDDKNNRQVGVVAGVGFAVPIANRLQVSQASINVHAWYETSVMRNVPHGARNAFIFGPSISIGNVGTSL